MTPGTQWWSWAGVWGTSRIPLRIAHCWNVGNFGEFREWKWPVQAHQLLVALNLLFFWGIRQSGDSKRIKPIRKKYPAWRRTSIGWNFQWKILRNTGTNGIPGNWDYDRLVAVRSVYSAWCFPLHEVLAMFAWCDQNETGELQRVGQAGVTSAVFCIPGPL